MKISIFEINLTKTDNQDSTLDSIDKLLTKHQIESKGKDIPIKIAKQSAAHCLQKMLKDNYFCVCSVNAAAQALCVQIPEVRRKIYQAAHCIHWSNMEEDFREALITMVLDDFREIFININEIENAAEIA